MRRYYIFPACLRGEGVTIGLVYILEVSNYFITDFQGVNFVKSGNTFLKLRSLILGLKNMLGACISGYYCTVVMIRIKCGKLQDMLGIVLGIKIIAKIKWFMIFS